MKIDPEDMISQAEAARIRGVTHQAIVNLVKNGKLHAMRLGGKVFLSRKEVERYEPNVGGRPKGGGKKGGAKAKKSN